MTDDFLGLIALDEADLPRALVLFEESMGMRRQLGDRRGLALALHNPGSVHMRQCEYEEARSMLRESLVLTQELGDKDALAICLEGIAKLATEQGDHVSAVYFWSAAEQLADQQRTPAREEDRAELQRAVELARGNLGAASVEDAVRKGKTTPIELVVKDAQG